MSDEDFGEYLRDAIDRYALAQVAAKVCGPEDAKAVAVKTYEKLLPNGVGTHGHHLYNAFNAMEKVGMIWLAEQDRVRKTGFIYDVIVVNALRRRGIGLAILRAGEGMARLMGLETLRLHVVGDNFAARGLYRKAGFGEASVVMVKELSDPIEQRT
ncbi:GNAT family N-acetyltransferase [Amycolatopsis sp. CA-230715]|uniref:GNAT family N-acetyltransferase n=1 Tax=Amycolatopsis sp. CA-230715 TaxID=2745196 RepID=UPI001C0164A5|nr:GNAT family N-acetyltransferase [Amycolatopsis sp. CA-230715]